MNTVIKHFENILLIGRPTFIVIALFSAIAAWIIKDYLANPAMFIFIFPLLFTISVLFQYLFILAELFPPSKIDQWLMWTIVAAICGTFLGTGLLAAFVATRDRWRKPLQPKTARSRLS